MVPADHALEGLEAAVESSRSALPSGILARPSAITMTQGRVQSLAARPRCGVADGWPAILILEVGLVVILRHHQKLRRAVDRSPDIDVVIVAHRAVWFEPC